jgi:H+/gluconate symporter-like permease
MTDEWVVPAVLFLILGSASVGAGRASGWYAHIQGNPHGALSGYFLGVCLWFGSVISAAYLGAFVFQ